MDKSIEERFIRLEAGYELVQSQLFAQQQVFVWLLDRFPRADALAFLQDYESQCHGQPRFEQDVVLLNALREDLLAQSAAHA